MSILGFGKKMKDLPLIDFKGSIYAEKSTIGKLTEQFKGEVEKRDVKFPENLGEEHPFNLSQMDKLAEKFGFYNAILDKYVDYIWGPGFFVKCEDARALEIIEKFIEDVDFMTIGRAWTKDGLNKGSGYLELGGSKKEGVKGLKKLNASYMYVVRDNKGIIKSYNQYKGAFNNFAKEKVIPFDKENIAQFNFNTIGDSAYGFGLGYPAMKLIDDWLLMQNSRHTLMDRKANAPLHAKLGYVSDSKEIIPKSEDVTSLGKDIETMSNKTNWTTGPLVDFKVIEFGKIGDKFDGTLQDDLDMLFYAFQVPPVIMGKSNVPEGLARVQMDAFQRRIQAVQAELEKVIEQKIFRRVLLANGFDKTKGGKDIHVEFEWGTPSVMEVEAKLKLISELIKSPTISTSLNYILEDKMVDLLDLDKDDWEKLKAEQEKEDEERDRLEQQPQPIVPGQNAKFPQPVKPKAEQPKQPKPEEIAKNIITAFEEKDKQRLEIDETNRKKLFMELEKQRKEEVSRFDKMFKEMKEEAKRREEEIQKKEEARKLKKINKLKKKSLLRTMQKNKTSLLPYFKVSRKTESYDKKIYIKRKPELMNYEYKKDCQHCLEAWDNYNTIQEWLGFSYKKYLNEILKIVGVYGFEYLKAVNEIELEAGYLTEEQTNEVRKILDNGFREGKGIKEMAKEVDKKVKPKDLYRMNEDGTIFVGKSGFPVLARSAEKRAVGIVRSEVTRAANLGAEQYYKNNGITHERWVASFGDRTCADCEALNGTIYEIGDYRPEIPLHPMCRCTLSPVVELKSKGKVNVKERKKK